MTLSPNDNPLNVFRGPEAVKDYFDPDKNPPTALVEIPDALNPYRDDGVRIFAKMHTTLAAQNVKALPGPFRPSSSSSLSDKISDESVFSAQDAAKRTRCKG
jgi:hypothetical protein